ncbi:photosynthetic NDH subunit of lumenal location 4, chloroplastic isoform X2 [Lotus japonicus]|uniref:photosynthetic NDH subunit of lumenal location 4, chloroplastic isoform X2 n=1 Tax=Lotus japonicus TaxID=34305 RepID=UPI0025880BED|nr:photosynthetic NDH subunit of lumenal location 4, chloroplastic isoform X2 [Lotus japonicus]
MALSLSSCLTVPNRSSSSCVRNCKVKSKVVCCSARGGNDRNRIWGIGVGVVAACVVGLTALEADATRIEYYATVGEPLCELNYVKSGLGYCDIVEGFGDEAPRAELINVHYTARFGDGTVFDSTYKRGRPLTMRIGVGKVIRGLDQGIFGGDGVTPMRIGIEFNRCV